MTDDIREEQEIIYKVGIKVLSEVQLENVLPTYHNLFRKIDVCRKVAQQELKISGRHYQYNLMYDNIFSILGHRGTGKTSVAFTLEKMIKDMYEDTYHDIVLPLIIPEAIPENCSILGWLLAIVKDEIEDLEKNASDKGRSNGEHSFWDQCRNNESPLLDKLEHITQLFHAGSYNPSNEISYYKAVDNSVVQAEDYYQFAKSIAELWAAWVKRIQELYPSAAGQDACPMIYFIFDDVDLAPHRIEQLLSVMIKYLSHPNIIVLTTAHEDLFLEVIENHLDRNIGRMPKEWRKYLLSNQHSRYINWEDTVIEKDDELVGMTARMYLGKVLPTSTRYYLRTFHTAKQKELFCLKDNCNLGQGVHEKICELLDATGLKNEDFMMQNNRIINFYLKYMGNTSRQISNVYIAMQEFIDNMILIVRNESEQNRERIINTIYQDCRYFTRVALNANHELSDSIQKIDDFIDEVLLSEYNQWKVYISYTQLTDFLLENMSNYDTQERIDIGLQLFSLFAFVENVLLLMEQGVDDGITNRGKIHAIPFLADYIEKIAFEKRHILRKKLNPKEFLIHYNDLLDRMDVITASGMSDRKFNMEYFYNFRNDTFGESRIKERRLEAIYWTDRQWFRSLVGMLSMVYGNVYLFDADNMAECVVFTEYGQLSECKDYIDREIKANIGKCFKEMKMQDSWLKMKKHYKDALSEAPQEGASADIYEELTEVIIELIENQSYDGYYTEVSKVIAECLVLLKSEESNMIPFCPQIAYPIIQRDIFLELSEMRKRDFEDYDETRAMLLEYREKIAGFETKIGECAILEDRDVVINQLNRLQNTWWIKRRLHPINNLTKRIEKETSEQDKLNCTISKNLYLELISELNQIAIEVKKAKGTYFEDENEMEEILGLVADLASEIKLGVRVHDHNREEIKKILKMTIEILSFELLQAAYIYQTIFQRYENNNLSSKALEKVKTEKGQEDTYYYSIYEKIINYLQETKVRDRNDMRKDIESAFMGERQRYVDRLFAEVADE